MSDKGKGCLKGCLITGAVLLVIAIVGTWVVISQGGKLYRWGVDQVTGGGVGVEAPAGFRQIPLPLALEKEGSRSGSFVGTQSPAAARESFTGALRGDGWVPVQPEEATAEAFAFFLQDQEATAGMSIDFFEKGPDLLLLYVVGGEEGTMVNMIALPRDAFQD